MKKLLIIGWGALSLAQALATFGWLSSQTGLGGVSCALLSMFCIYPLIGTALGAVSATHLWDFTPTMAFLTFGGDLLLLTLATWMHARRVEADRATAVPK